MRAVSASHCQPIPGLPWVLPQPAQGRRAQHQGRRAQHQPSASPGAPRARTNWARRTLGLSVPPSGTQSWELRGETGNNVFCVRWPQIILSHYTKYLFLQVLTMQSHWLCQNSAREVRTNRQIFKSLFRASKTQHGNPNAAIQIIWI